MGELRQTAKRVDFGLRDVADVMKKAKANPDVKGTKAIL